MTNVWHWVVSGSFGFVGGLIGGTFKWFIPSWKDWEESRKATREASKDKKVLVEIRALCEGNSSIFETREIATRLGMDTDDVADSLERLETASRVQNYDHIGWRSKSR